VCLLALCRSGMPRPSELPHQPEHNHGPRKGDDGPDVHARGAGVPKGVKDPAPHDGTDDTNHQISKETCRPSPGITLFAIQPAMIPTIIHAMIPIASHAFPLPSCG